MGRSPKWVAEVAVSMAMAVTSVARAEAPAPPPDDLNRWGLICYCNSRVATPHYPVSIDDNGRILFYARNGATAAELASHRVAPSSSQLQLLQDWGLLIKQGDLVTTNFPVLGPEEMGRLRGRISQSSARLLPALRPKAIEIVKALKLRGRADSAYAVIFSYVLDNLVWDRLNKTGQLPDMRVDAEHPFWAGTFWAVYPERTDMPGTNDSVGPTGTLKATWTKPVLSGINRVAESESVHALLRSEKSDAFVGSSAWLTIGSEKTSVLLLIESSNDPLIKAAQDMASQVAAELASQDFSDVIPNASKSQRLLIATHELIWDLNEKLDREAEVKRPAALDQGGERLGELAPLLILVRKSDEAGGSH